jgi:hypothetical protein
MNFGAARAGIPARPLGRRPCLCRTGLSHISSMECSPVPPDRKTVGYRRQASDNGRCRYLSLAVSRGFIAFDTTQSRRILGQLHWPALRPSSGPKEVRHETAQPPCRMASPLRLVAEEYRPGSDMVRWDSLGPYSGTCHRSPGHADTPMNRPWRYNRSAHPAGPQLKAPTPQGSVDQTAAIRNRVICQLLFVAM